MYSIANKTANIKQTDKLDISEILTCIYFAICFWEPYLNYLIGSVTKYFLLLIIIITAIKKDKFYLKSHHFSVLLWFSLMMLSLLWVNMNVSIRSNLLSLIGMVLFYVVITSVKHSKNFVNWLVYSTYGASFSVALASVFFSEPYHGEFADRLVLTVLGTQNDPNNDAALKLFCFVFAMCFIFISKKFRWFHVIAALISVYTIFLTGSRGGMLAVFFAVLIMFFTLQKGFSFSKKILLVLAIIFISIIAYYIISKYLPQNIFNRLFKDEYGDGSNRLTIWKQFMPFFYRSPLWGSGWDCYWDYSPVGCHNVYVEVLVETGILGFLGIFYPIFKAVYCSFKKNELAISVATLMASELVVSFFLGSLNKRFFWLPIIMCVIVGLNDSGEYKNENSYIK